jgi:hypothetical protein
VRVVRLWQRTRRRVLVVAVWVFAALTVVLGGVWVASRVGQWSWMEATAAWPRDPARGGAWPGVTLEERHERHTLFGQGLIGVHSMTVYSQDLSAPTTDANSRGLLWATAPQMLPAWKPWLVWPSPAGRTVLVRTWVGPVVGGVMLIAAWVWLRRVPMPGHCGGCGYDVRPVSAGATGRCPECGAAFVVRA